MKRNLFDLLDAYQDESVDLNGNTPLSPTRIKELTMSRINQKNRANIPVQKQASIPRHLIRGILIAAVIASLCCLTVFAITFSLRDTARTDMGISTEKPVPEWTEYDSARGTERDGAHTALLATMCSGSQVSAYLEVSPIPEEAATAVLAGASSPQYEWDLSGIHPTGCSYLTEQTGYDPETQTALVKVQIRGEALEATDQVELKLALTRDLKEVKTYGPFVIPITSSESISCPANTSVANTRAHFEMVWDAYFEPLNIPDYVSEGRIQRISIYTGYIEVELETPDIAQWFSESGAEQAEIEVPAGMEKQHIIDILFYDNWIISVNEALKGATLNYKDGTHNLIVEMPRDYAAVWHLDSDHMDLAREGNQTYRFIPKQAIDLSAIASITICGTEYSFGGINETEP